ncbi:translation activator [Aureococcus anophagefferens]|nr:translation activator [Aureococcus anophagefferens]
MGKAKGKKGKRGQESDDDDDYVDPIKAAMAAAGGDGDDEPAGMATKKGNKKKGKGKKGAESDDDEPPAPEPAKQLTKAQERKAKKKGKNAATAPARTSQRPAADDGAPKKPSRAELRKQKKAKKGGKAADRKKDKKAQRKAAAMAAMAADESDEEEEEPAEEEGKKKMSKAERRKLKSKGGDEAPEPEAAEEAEEAKVVSETAPAGNAMFGGKKKKKSAFGAAAAAADSGPRPRGAERLRGGHGRGRGRRRRRRRRRWRARERLDKYEKKLAKAVKKGEDTTKYAEKIKKYEARLAELAAAERARAAEREADAGGEGGAHGRRPPVQGRRRDVRHLPRRSRGGKPLSSKAKRKLEKDYASRKREAEELKAKELASLEGAQFACSQSAINENDAAWQNALDVKIDSFTISAAGKTLFQDASLLIAHGKRYGICLYVEQEVQADDTCAVDAVVRADAERSALLAEEKALAAKLEAGGLAAEDQQATSERLSAVGSELLAIGAHAAESKARRILFGLGFSAEMQQRATKLFSGGWRMRISLARALFMEPVLLMLDEPTNHLDLNAVIWLDDYLQKYKHTILVVSHDQDFLNSVCDEMLHISEERTLDHYRGNYDTFKTLEQQKRAAQLKAWEKQEKQLRALKGKSNSKAKAEELVMKAAKAKREPGARSKKAQAIAAGQDTADVAALIEKPKEYLVEMEFPPVTKLSPPVLQVMDAHFRYAPDLPHIFNDMNFGIDQDSRVCIVGNNGSGKTTLLHLLTGKLAATEARSSGTSGSASAATRTIAMRDLSGGQKARVVLCELSSPRPTCSSSTSPRTTSTSRPSTLCDAINGYDGGVICVTHDARLIEATNMRLWVVENRQCVEWGEPFDKYREHLLEKLERAMADQDQRVTAAGLSVDMGGNRN